MTKPAAKLARLMEYLSRLDGAAVAFSGGVDSTFLLEAAHRALGPRALAVTGRSPSFPARELSAARRFTRGRGLAHLEVETGELSRPEFSANPVNRCYLCKRLLLAEIRTVARAHGLAEVLEASNVDDEDDFRPGLKAVEELGALSPLRRAGLTKSDIRLLSRTWGLETWDKPSQACLVSRFPYGEPLKAENFRKVEAAEDFLLELGCRQVRVRCHDQGRLARIETDEAGLDLLAAPDNRRLAAEKLSGLGFAYIALDLQGYRSGSLNETRGRTD